MPPDAGSGRFLAAAEAGIPFAMIEMLFRYGAHGKESTVCQENKPEAVVWARKAIEAGEPLGWHELGYCITNGVGVERSEFEGMQTYERSRRELGPNDVTGYYTLATFRIGNMYTEGRGVTRDLVKGIEMIREAVNAGSAQANHRLAYLHENGIGVPKDMNKALQYYMEAAKYHYGLSETNIGWLIHSGNGFRRDYETAANWYRSAALHGEPQAMYNLGQMYENGEGLTRSIEMAQQWYKKAADLGHVEAKKELGGN
jgi:TPR repeat protein